MQVLTQELDEFDVIVSEKVEFNKEDKEKYYTKFKECISNGVIRDGTRFEADKWYMRHGGEEQSIIFPNDIQYKKLSIFFEREFEDFILAYKSFILYHLNNRSIVSFNRIIKRIADVDINETTLLDRRYAGLFHRLADYIKIPYRQMEIFDRMIGPKRAIEYERTLPDFIDVFKMSDIVNDIVENKDMLEYKDYLLTIMWWKICSIIPLRPTEFLRTKFECIYEKDNAYCLKVMRTKLKGTIKPGKIKKRHEIDGCYLEDEVTIDESLYNLILKYRDILKNNFHYDKGLELFPISVVYDAKYHTDKAKASRLANEEIVIYRDLYTNIKRFYEDIIKKEYGLTPIPKWVKKDDEGKGKYIQKLVPYDARHIAIINLVLLGVDVLEVMYLAGHNDVNTAYGYFNHVKTFSKGYALGYATYSKNKGIIDESKKINNSDYKTEKNDRYQFVLDSIKGISFEPVKVSGGYCYYRNIKTDKSVCHKHDRKHSLCIYFKSDNHEFYKKEIDRVEKELDTDIKILKDLILDMNGISKFNELYQTTSFRISKEISELSVLNKKILDCE